MEPLLSVRDLRVHFRLDEGVVKAVDGVDFDVPPAGTMAIVGESGCGKSVTARAILCLVDRPGRIVSGHILWRCQGDDGGEQVVDLARLAPNGTEIRRIRGREIALVFQEPMTSFSPVHTVGNQIMEAILLHQMVGRREARQIAIAMLGRVGVPDPEQRVDEYPHALSGGLRQRAMIAMALSCNPRLLIADEPTTALDVTTQAQILELLRQLQRQNDMAVILVTHDLGVVAQMADEVVVMYLGRVAERGPVDAVFHAAKHPYTQALLRSTPRLRATWEGKPAEAGKLATISGAVPHPYQRPPGCPFHNRCTEFMPGTCDAAEPQPSLVGDSHVVSCFLYPQGG